MWPKSGVHINVVCIIGLVWVCIELLVLVSGTSEIWLPHHMMHACIYIRTRTVCANTHTHIHTHTCMRTRAHTHTHTQILVEYKIYCCTYALVMNQLVFVLISIVNCPSIWNKCKVALNFSFHEAQSCLVMLP